MMIRILGAGAGGGLPQWNCSCPQCAAARRGEIASLTQSSAAVSDDGAEWVLLNASPDIRQQLAAAPALHPRQLRGSPVSAVVLTNADVDHIAGLLTLREKTPFTLFASGAVLATIRANSIFGVLDPAVVTFVPIALDTAFFPIPGLRITPFAVPGKVALYLENGASATDHLSEHTIGLTIECGTRRFDYVPGCAAISDHLVARLSLSDLLFFDGTVWQDEEMPNAGVGAKTGARMGHVAMSGPEGSLARLASLSALRFYTHINNTNPVLLPDSPEHREVRASGWQLAFDGMELNL
jgi:pyrroloquinoline quinone biosynthesis protein B